MSKQSLLLVDGDTRSLRVLEVSLRKAGFMVTAAVSVQDALDKLALHAPDLIISETTFPEGDGFELRRRVRATPDWSEIPFIFLTAEAAIENKIRGLELGVDDYLTKPIYIKEIVTRINILLQKRQRVRFEERRDGRTRFAGRVQDMPVVDVIQTIEISRKSGVIQFVGERGRQAAIYFRDGRVIDAEAGALQGEDAVYRLLTWSEGEFEVVFRTVRRREVITVSSQGLLMEGMRRLDEWSRLFEQLPPLTHRFEVDTIELATRLGDVPDDNNRILRLFDGKRTLLEVIDASDVGDLECLQAISRLYFEELLLDLDHGRSPRRDTGRPMLAAEAETPTPIEDAASGPTAQAAGAAAAAMPPRARATTASAKARSALVSKFGAMPGAAASMEAAAADVDDGFDDGAFDEGTYAPAARAAEPAAAAVTAVATTAAPAVPAEPATDEAVTEDAVTEESAVSEAAVGERDAAAEDSDAAGEPTEDEPADAGASGAFAAVGPLMGGYRPSSLRLIDEAVAAAQAIEPSLFEDPPRSPATSGGNGAGSSGASPAREAGSDSRPSAAAGGSTNARLLAAVASAASVGTAQPVAPAGPDPASAGPAVARTTTGGKSAAGEPAASESVRMTAAEREESGLRMIGSLGRDRAEASGELAQAGHTRPLRSETARELVTILPRRITREVPVMTQELAESLPKPTPTSPVLSPKPVATSAVESAAPSLPPRVLPGSGVRAPGLSQRLLRAARPDGRGPGMGALVLLILAGLLAGTAVFLRLRRHSSLQGARDAERTRAGSGPAEVGALGVDGSGGAGAGGAVGAGSGGAGAGGAVGAGAVGAGAGGAVGAGAGGAVGAGAVGAGTGGAGGTTAGASGAGGATAGASGTTAGAGPGGSSGAGNGGVTTGTGRGGSGAGGSTAGGGGSAAGGGGSAAGGGGSAAGAGKSGAPSDADRSASAKALYDKAHDAIDESNFTQALALADASLKLRKTARTYLVRAQAEQRLDHVDAALASVDAAAAISPELGAVWEMRGRILWAARRRDEARAAFDKFLQIEPNSAKAAGVRRLMNEPR